jgi:hypothetical protein
MAKFLCYFLRIIVDEEAGITRMHSNSNGDISGGMSSSDNSFFESDRARDAIESNGSSRSRHRQGRKIEADLTKDARGLLCPQYRQKVLAIRLWRAIDRNDEDTQHRSLLAA